MNIFLTGATGFIGRALTLRLTGDGHRVTVWTRSTRRARQILGAAVELLEITPDDAPLRRALAGADAVINLAGEPILGGRWTEARKCALIDSRVGVTQRLVQAMSACDARPRVLLSASATCYYWACAWP
jgi:NAD dependent epimerase/dehydratase family enzyme